MEDNYDWLPVIPAQLRLLFNENLSIVGAVIEEGVESTDDEDEEAGEEVTASRVGVVVIGGRRNSTR